MVFAVRDFFVFGNNIFDIVNVAGVDIIEVVIKCLVGILKEI